MSNNNRNDYPKALTQMRSVIINYKRRDKKRKERYGNIASIHDFATVRLLKDCDHYVNRLRTTLQALERYEVDTLKLVHQKSKDKMASRGAPQSTVK